MQEECYAPPVEPEAWKELNNLNLENDLLKMQLKQLQDCTTLFSLFSLLLKCAPVTALTIKQSPWIEPDAPGNIYEEQMRPLEKWWAY